MSGRYETVTPEILRQLIRFDEATGEYFWKERDASLFKNERRISCFRSRFVGKKLFTKPTRHGYGAAIVLGYSFLAHQIVWAFHHGEWPKMIDHINGDRFDNRLENLRECTPSENQKNKAMLARNTSGRIGVTWNRQRRKWYSSIRVENKYIFLGSFHSLDDASDARARAEKLYGFHPNHGGRRFIYAR